MTKITHLWHESNQTGKGECDLPHPSERDVIFSLFRPLLLECHQFKHLLGNVLGADLEFLDQLPGSARVSETILHANCPSDYGQSIQLRTFRENAAQAPCQSANLMLLGSDD